MKNIVLLSVIFILLQGCSSIDQPTASRSLVEEQSLTTTASTDKLLSSALSSSSVGSVIALEDHTIVLGNKFFAATGRTCRKLSSKQTGQDIYCLNDQGGWFQVNKVISEYNESEMSEAGL